MDVLSICVRTDDQLIEKQVNGRLVYSSPSASLQQWLDWFSLLHHNVSMFASRVDLSLCTERLVTNKSHLTSEIFLPKASETAFSVPVPSIPIKISILTGYDVKDITVNTVDALGNFSLFEVDVYLLLLIFFIMFCLFVAVGTIFLVKKELLLLDAIQCSGGGSPRLRWCRKVISRRRYILRLMKRQEKEFLTSPRSRFKWISFLLNVLIFFLIAHFRSAYSTNHIIVRKPDLSDSYEKLARAPKANPFFIDSFANASDLFSGEPASSRRGRVWSKYKPQKHLDSLSLLDKLKATYDLMRRLKSAVIISSLTVRAAKFAFCGLSPEDRAIYMSITADDSEGEELRGFPLSHSFEHRKSVARKLQLFTQSGCIPFLLDKAGPGTYDMIRTLSPPSISRAHVFRQKLICSGDIKVDPHLKLDPVAIDFWMSFSFLLAYLLFSFFFVLFAEHIISRSRKRTRHRVARVQRH